MRKLLNLLMALIVILSLTACGSTNQNPTNTQQKSSDQLSKPVEATKVTEAPKPSNPPATTETQSKVEAKPIIPPAPEAPNKYTAEGQLKVHFIDVGQADAILIHDGPSAMLIDAGNNDDATNVVNYIKQQGITKLDYLIGTHPHEDHIGGLDAVINSFDIGTVYMPKVTANTKTFTDVVTSLKNKNLQATVPKPGDLFDLAGSQCTILAPNNSSYEDLNDHSIVIKLVHGSVSFLLTGDAAAVSEMEMVKKGYSLGATVLKVGHHGSKTSSSANFLSAVKPKYTVISVGKGNEYGHPEASAITRLKGIGAQIFRTDEAGTIIATSDKTNVTINAKPITSAGVSSTPNSANTNVNQTAPAATNPPAQTQPATENNDRNIKVWLASKTGSVYHDSPECSNMKSPWETTLGYARDKGIKPCSKCDPPK